MKSLLVALRFLTVVPVPGAFTERDLERTPPWFPPVGLLIGLSVALFDTGGAHIGLNPVLQSILSVGLLAGVTGALHLDGLADTADGFLSSRPRERALEIMRDSRIGAMGVLALLFVLALKVAALTDIAAAMRWRALLLSPLAGRCMQLASLELLPYARNEGGLAAVFIRRRQRILILWAILWLVAGAVILFGLNVGMGLVAFVLLGTAGMASWSLRRIGGFTGDTLGATSELIEALLLILVSFLGSAGWIS